MFHSYHVVLGTAVLVAMGLLSGCIPRSADHQQKTTDAFPEAAQDTSKQDNHAPHEEHASMDTASAGVPAGLSELSAEDRAIAETQRVCPVSGDILEAHGKPYKVTVKGQVVLLCCPACKKELLANPDKYLAKSKTEKPK